MTLTLDPQLEQRIRREIELGHGRDAAEVITRALDLADDESWSEEEKFDLQESFALARAQAARGEVIAGKDLREDYERRRALRAE